MFVLPIAADTGSFRSHISLFNPYTASNTFDVRYFPADGTTQATFGSLQCSQVTVPASSTLGISNLREICPTLAAGSQFGYLEFVRANSNGDAQQFDQLGIHAFSRVINANGQGFSIEALPLHDIVTSRQTVTGLRRLVATAGSPEYQTNCFVGTLSETPSRPINILLQDETGQQIGNTISVTLGARRLLRYLDIFSAAGLPSGNYDNIKALFVTFDENNNIVSGDAEFFSFCTVQDNTSFGADFRIGKAVFVLDSNRLKGFSGISADALGRPLIFPNTGYDEYILLATEARRPDRIACTASAYDATVPSSSLQPVSMEYLQYNAVSKKLEPATTLTFGGNSSVYSDFIQPKSHRNNGTDSLLYLLLRRRAIFAPNGSPLTAILTCMAGSVSSPIQVSAGNYPFIAPTNP